MLESLTSRERVALTLAHQEADRIPRYDNFWPETIECWRAQGLPADTDPFQYFPFDFECSGWTDHYARPGVKEILDSNDEWELFRDGNQATLRYFKNRSGAPEHVAFEIDTPDKWLELKRTLLEAPIEGRIDIGAVLAAQANARSRGKWFTWQGVCCFEAAQAVLGHVNLCVAMVEDPEWAKDIFDTEAEIAVRALDYMEANGVRFDGGWPHGDLAYNHGPFFSPRMYRDLILPGHRRHFSWFAERALPVISHSDGDIRPLIPHMLEAGVNCIQPMEAKVGMDVRELKPLYGERLAFMGNIDVTVLITNDAERIETEIAAKVPLAKKGGGYIYYSDHSIPPQVTLQTYRNVMELLDIYGKY